MRDLPLLRWLQEPYFTIDVKIGFNGLGDVKRHAEVCNVRTLGILSIFRLEPGR